VGHGFGEVFASYSQGDEVCLFCGFKRGCCCWCEIGSVLMGRRVRVVWRVVSRHFWS